MCTIILPPYIKDTNKFLKIIHFFPILLLPNFLYTNIQHTQGLSALEIFLSYHFHISCPLPIFTHNFSYNSHHYLQVKDIGMGTRMALSYMNPFMDNLEKELLYHEHLNNCYPFLFTWSISPFLYSTCSASAPSTTSSAATPLHPHPPNAPYHFPKLCIINASAVIQWLM